jgi:hypothetical protein
VRQLNSPNGIGSAQRSGASAQVRGGRVPVIAGPAMLTRHAPHARRRSGHGACACERRCSTRRCSGHAHSSGSPNTSSASSRVSRRYVSRGCAATTRGCDGRRPLSRSFPQVRHSTRDRAAYLIRPNPMQVTQRRSSDPGRRAASADDATAHARRDEDAGSGACPVAVRSHRDAHARSLTVLRAQGGGSSGSADPCSRR